MKTMNTVFGNMSKSDQEQVLKNAIRAYQRADNSMEKHTAAENLFALFGQDLYQDAADLAAIAYEWYGYMEMQKTSFDQDDCYQAAICGALNAFQKFGLVKQYSEDNKKSRVFGFKKYVRLYMRYEIYRFIEEQNNASGMMSKFLLRIKRNGHDLWESDEALLLDDIRYYHKREDKIIKNPEKSLEKLRAFWKKGIELDLPIQAAGNKLVARDVIEDAEDQFDFDFIISQVRQKLGSRSVERLCFDWLLQDRKTRTTQQEFCMENHIPLSAFSKAKIKVQRVARELIKDEKDLVINKKLDINFSILKQAEAKQRDTNVQMEAISF